jgi:hypothetical protein
VTPPLDEISRFNQAGMTGEMEDLTVSPAAALPMDALDTYACCCCVFLGGMNYMCCPTSFSPPNLARLA